MWEAYKGAIGGLECVWDAYKGSTGWWVALRWM